MSEDNLVSLEEQIELMKRRKASKRGDKLKSDPVAKDPWELMINKHEENPFLGAFAGKETGDGESILKKNGESRSMSEVAKIIMFNKSKRLEDLKLCWIKENGTMADGGSTIHENVPAYWVKNGVVLPIGDYPIANSISSDLKISFAKSKELWQAIKNVLASDSQYHISRKEIKSIGFKDDDGLFWVKLGITRSEVELSPVKLDDVPEFKSFLDLCLTEDDRKALVLFIGSIFDDDSQRYQYLHLYGEGGEGKSTLTSALLDLFGDKGMSASANQIEDKHFGEGLEGVRLLVLPDENNPSFVQGGMWKRLTGDETTTINPKNKKPYAISLTFKAIVTSNVGVKISAEEHATRRLLSVRMRAPNAEEKEVRPNSWQRDFKKSIEKIVAYCIGEWEMEKASNPGVSGKTGIPCPSDNMKLAQEAQYQNIVDAMAEIRAVAVEYDGTNATRIKRSLFMKVLSSNGLGHNDNKTKSDIKSYLNSIGVVEKKIAGEFFLCGIKMDMDAKFRKQEDEVVDE